MPVVTCTAPAGLVLHITVESPHCCHLVGLLVDLVAGVGALKTPSSLPVDSGNRFNTSRKPPGLCAVSDTERSSPLTMGVNFTFTPQPETKRGIFLS